MIALLAVLAFAQAAPAGPYPPDPDCQIYGDGSTIAMAECLSAQSDTWERRLDAAYAAALASGEVDRVKLRQAQRAWLRYRDANCEMYDAVSGSIHTILAGTCQRNMTRDRTLELTDMRWTG